MFYECFTIIEFEFVFFIFKGVKFFVSIFEVIIKFEVSGEAYVIYVILVSFFKYFVMSFYVFDNCCTYFYSFVVKKVFVLNFIINYCFFISFF